MLAIIVALVCAIRPAIITGESAAQREYLKGLRVYLALVEAERFTMLQSPEGADRIDVGDRAQVVKVYERPLPFAVLWGVEKEWSTELAVRLAGEYPAWYQGGVFTPIAFGAAMGRFSGAATSASVPVPASTGSTSGGSMGGGFSRGGGGDGGGR